MGQRSFLLLFFALAIGISWAIWAPLWLPGVGVEGLPVLPFHHAIGALGPITSALIVTRIESGWSGVREILNRMVRGGFVWVLVGILGPFFLLVCGAIAAGVITGESLSLQGFGVSKEFPQFSAFGFLLYNIFSFGYGEETGWRGYALPRLQARYSAFIATLLLTVGWALWHVPLFLYRPGYTRMGWEGILGWLFSLLCGAVILTWLFNESRGSILVVALFHAAIDIAFTSDLSSPLIVNVAGAMVTLWGIALLFIVDPRDLSKHGKVAISHANSL